MLSFTATEAWGEGDCQKVGLFTVQKAHTMLTTASLELLIVNDN